MGLFSRQGSPAAKIADGRLVLTLPDAETPALWVMDLNDTATSVLRLETDRQGFFILKKHGAKGAAETIAVYRDRERGARALGCASKAFEKARSTRGGARSGSIFGRIALTLLTIWFALYLLGLDRVLLGMIFAQPQAQQQMAAPATAPQTAQPEEEAPAGVPLSADEFLKSQQTTPR